MSTAEECADESPKTPKASDFQKICRTCFSEKDLNPISCYQIEDTPLVEMFASFLNVTIDPANSLPQYICRICATTFHMIYVFKIQCLRMENVLKLVLKEQEQEQGLEEQEKEIENKIVLSHDFNKNQTAILFVPIQPSEKPKTNEERKVILKCKPNKKKRPKVYKCRCSKRFKSREELTEHRAQLLCEPKFQKCPHCEMEVAPSSFHTHLKLHTGARKFFHCEHCPKSFKIASNYKRHLLVHTGEKKFVCEKCGKGFIQRHWYNAHVKSKHTEDLTCYICDRTFCREISFQAHLRIHFPDEPAEPEENPETNLICEETFANRSQLKSHSKVHTGKKRYLCEVCKRAFANSRSLALHKLTHTGDKPHACDECPKKFKKFSHLKDHKRSHSVEKPFTCSVCSKKFTRSRNLKAHERLHTGEKPVACPICNEKFFDTPRMKRHKKTHHLDSKSSEEVGGE